MPLFRRKQDTSSVDLPVGTLKAMLDRGERVLVVDVRQPDGYRTHPFTIPGAVRIAPPDLPDRFGELPRDRLIALFCT
jgi:rhodanese-related sulfurtransferase